MQLSSDGGPAVEQVTHALDPMALWAEAMLGGRGDWGVALGKASTLQGVAETCPNPCGISGSCLCLCCLEMSLHGPVSLSSHLLPVHVHRRHPTQCVLSSALWAPPGSRALPGGISVSAEAKYQLRQS